MRFELKVADYNWNPGTHNEMIYENDRGEYFIGPPQNVTVGKVYTIEVSDKLLDDLYYRIIKFVD